ncbi:MAG: hypothetical protein U0572_03805 [Phycisphaerales bacterium]
MRSIGTLLVLLTLALVADHARAQLVSSPSAIGYREFIGAIRERGGGVPLEAWPSIRAEYQRYLEGCEALRFGADAAAFHDLRARGAPPPDVDVRTVFRDDVRRIRPQRTLDEALVEAAIASLPSDSPRGPILRTWCERRWLLEIASENDHSTSRYLPGALRRVRLSEPDAATVRAAMDDLEQRLVGVERRRFEAIPRSWHAYVEAKRTMMPRPRGDADPSALEAWAAARRAATRPAWRDLREAERDIDRMVDNAVTDLLPRLSIQGRRMVAAAVLRTCFSNIGYGDPAGPVADVHRWMRRIAAQSDRSAEAQSMIDGWRDEDDRLVAEYLTYARQLGEARLDDALDPLPDGRERTELVVASLERIAGARSERAQALRSRFSSTFGVGDSATDDDSTEPPTSAGNDPALADLVEEESESGEQIMELSDAGANVFGDTMWVDAPPRYETLAAMLDRFQCDPLRRAAMTDVHTDLVEAWANKVIPLMTATGSVNMLLPNGEYDPQGPQRLVERAQAARTTAGELERSFFDGLAALAIGDESDAVATWRLAEIIGSPHWAMTYRLHLPMPAGAFSAARRHSNIALAIRVTPLGDDARRAAEHVIAQEGSALEAAHRALDEAEVVAFFDASQSRLRFMAAQRNRATMAEAAKLYERELQEIGKRVDRAAASRAAAEEGVLSSLASAIDAESFGRVRRTGLRLMYPGLDADRRGMSQLADRALRIPTLDPVRTAAIAEAVEWWSDEYDALTDRLAELGVEPQPDASGRIPTQVEHEQRTSWLRFRRDQAGLMMSHAIACALTEAERRECQHLPNP